jgi:UDP-N-acetylmuramoylalanine--D-glutamate ligase
LGDVGVVALRVAGLAEAVEAARGLASPGGAVLLSPGCASFDAFQNFEHRGQVFRALARGGAS